MASLKIRTFKDGSENLDTTVTIPLNVLKVASRLMPKQAVATLEEKGFDVNQILKLSQNKNIRGTLIEIEEHKKNEKVVIAIE